MGRNDNILDAADKHTKPRTCPECGYQFPFSLFLKRYVMKFGFLKWTCPSCNEFIKYNYTKSNIIGAVIFFACIFSVQFLQLKFGWDLPKFIFLIPYFLLGLILLNFDKLVKYN